MELRILPVIKHGGLLFRDTIEKRGLWSLLIVCYGEGSFKKENGREGGHMFSTESRKMTRSAPPSFTSAPSARQGMVEKPEVTFIN
jgi:hypothetical protein